MSTPINLNRVRKEKARADKVARAAQNSVKFGRDKAQKILETAKADAAKRLLDQHRKET